MNIATSLVLMLASWWPFSHRPTPPTDPTSSSIVDSATEEELFPSSLCDKGNPGWFYEGPDGVGGYSTESCHDAYLQWKKTPVPSFMKMNRI